MSLTIDELCQSSCSRRRTSHATPARSHHTGVGTFCTTVFAPGLGPCPAFAPGRDARTRGAHRHSRLAGDRAGHGAPLHQLSPGGEPGHLVSPPRRVGFCWECSSRSWSPQERRSSSEPTTRVERRSGRKIRAKGCYRDAVRSTKKHVIRCFGLKWVSMMLLVPVPWSQRVWALPFLTALCRPAEQSRPAPAQDQCRLGPANDEASAPLAAWAPVGAGGRWRLCRGVAGLGLRQTAGDDGVALALGCRAVSPAGTAAPWQAWPQTHQGQRQRSLQGWAERSDTPWEDVEVDWYGDQRKKLWVFSRTGLWYTPRLPPVEIRYVW